MANTNAPMGFIPVTNGGVLTTTNRFANYTIASNYGTSIFLGDPVKSTGTGTLGRSGIIRADAGDTVRGVFGGIMYTDANTGEQKFSQMYTASTLMTNILAYVYDDPNTIFEIQSDSDSATPAAGDVGNKADFIAGTGSTVTFRSGYQLDTSNIGTGDGLLILDFVDRPDNSVGAYAKMRVLLREHELRGSLTAV